MWNRIKAMYWKKQIEISKAMVRRFDRIMGLDSPDWARRPFAAHTLRAKLRWKSRWYKASTKFAQALGFVKK